MSAAVSVAAGLVGLCCFAAAYVLLRKAFQQPVQPFDGGTE